MSKYFDKTQAVRKFQRGFVLSVETLLFSSILIAGTLLGWVNIRDAMNSELIDTANAITGSINFSYFSDPLRGTGSTFDADELLFSAPAPTESDPMPGTGGAGTQ
jgi:hypothetical protein